MIVCHVWLGVDFFVRSGFTLEADERGRRWAVRGDLRHELPPACRHEDCPPHPISGESKFRGRAQTGTEGHVPPSPTTNYMAVLFAEVLSLSCTNSTVEAVGDARPAEAMGQ